MLLWFLVNGNLIRFTGDRCVATLSNPEEQRSGGRMSSAPSEIQRRKPVFPNRFSPAARWVSVRCLRVLYPSRSSGARGSSKKWTSASRHPRRILRVAGAS
jgi:hypothetical protein